VLTVDELSRMGKVGHGPLPREMGKQRGLPSPFVQASARISQYQAREWNAKYQKILSTHVVGEEMILKRDILMIEVVGMFQDYSTTTAKSIIDNLHLNSSHGKKVFNVNSSRRILDS
jgi:hypothetical protein